MTYEKPLCLWMCSESEAESQRLTQTDVFFFLLLRPALTRTVWPAVAVPSYPLWNCLWFDVGLPVVCLLCFLLVLYVHVVKHLTNIAMQVYHHKPCPICCYWSYCLFFQTLLCLGHSCCGAFNANWVKLL